MATRKPELVVFEDWNNLDALLMQFFVNDKIHEFEFNFHFKPVSDLSKQFMLFVDKEGCGRTVDTGDYYIRKDICYIGQFYCSITAKQLDEKTSSANIKYKLTKVMFNTTIGAVVEEI